MQQRSFVIIGNGIAGVTAAEVLRTENGADTITVITDDPCPVFYRPALKDYLGGKVREEKLWARPISFYPDRQVHFLTGKVVRVQPTEHLVQLQNGQRIPYTRLLLAHGARATSLQCEGANLMGVTTLRTIADYQRVLAHLNHVQRAVVVGSGTLALESIETLRHRGYQVTHLLRKRTLWSDVLDQTASDLVLQQERRDGVDIRMEQEIARIVGPQGVVTGVVTTTGEHISCELVLVGIGIEPETGFVKEAGITCGRGVQVDAMMRTNQPDIYAAGDVVETSDPITRKARVIGQWYPAIQQARAAAYSMLDVMDRQYTFQFGNFYNACMLYGLDFASVGISVRPKDGKDYEEICADPQPLRYQKVILKRGVLVGMIALGDRRSVLTYKRAIDHRVNLSSVATQLFAPTFHLEKWLDQQGVPPALLGVSREEAQSVHKFANAEQTALPPALAQAGMQEAKLLPLSPPELASTLGLTYLSQMHVTTIGRQEGSQLHIPHPSVSRRHAEISYLNYQYILRDLGSSNGTALNGQRVQPSSLSRLNAGDQITFGEVAFVFQLQTVDAAASFLLSKKLVKAIISGNEKAADQTIQVSIPAALVPGQPTRQSDGSLILPELPQPLSVQMQAQLQKTPALIVIWQGQARIAPLTPQQRLLIGRQQDCELAIPDMSISRKHAEVFFLSGSFYIRDLDSSNGVLVNHQRISSAYRLAHEERVTLGSLVIYFMDYMANNQPTLFAPTPLAGQRTLSAPGGDAMRQPKPSAQSCRQCGSVFTTHAHFCPVCGAAQK